MNFVKKVLLAALLTGSICGSGLRAHSAVPSTPRRIEVTARRFAFEPSDVTLRKGEPVVLVLKSVDVPHGVRFRDFGIELKASKGSTAQAQFTPEKTGDFTAHCFVFCGSGHGTMRLTLHVVG